ncbi:ATP-binding protein [Nocardioides sp. W7]|uniref:ATP-binding protein n=1 Tax=Nocardioides sp. W7 TaxID=2931390 RepID=UPI001FD0E4BF|nr:ATP-binding protein [Nocardioides sp. W7]
MSEPAALLLPLPDPVRGLAIAAVERALAVLAPDPEPALVARCDQALAAARTALGAAIDEGIPLGIVAAQAALGTAETELLAVLVGAELDESLQRLLVSLTEDRDRHRVELWMLPHLLPGSTPALAGPTSGLVRAALALVTARGAFGRTAITLAPRLLWALWGDTRSDPALPVGAELVPVVSTSAPAWADGHDTVLVVGPDRARRRHRAAEKTAAVRLLVTPPPTHPDGWSAVVREATLAGAAVLLESTEPLSADGRRCIEDTTHLRWAISTSTPVALDDLPRRDWREFAPEPPQISQTEWVAVAGEADRPHALTAEQLDRMGQALGLTGGDSEAAYRRLTDARIDAVATRIVPRAGWDDLVLPPNRKQRLVDLVDRYRSSSTVYGEWGISPSPSRGLVALFSGKSGTGKTMGAEVVAGELGLDMYRLDLSAVVSKYIGETEKNLDNLFDAASIGGTVLFFDEADAMFGKRTEVTDSHDRYANVGTSYLLQRLERYDGIVILATNFEKNIDEAFIRRVHVRLDFQLPGESERQELWRRNLAAGMPLADDVDVEWLVSRFEMSGASIRNAVVDAAFLAARDGGSVGMAHLVQGTARELQKSSLRITRDKYGDWFDLAMASTSG